MSKEKQRDSRFSIAILFISLVFVTGGFILYGVFYVTNYNLTVESWVNNLLMFILGGLVTQVSTIINYYFGDSLNNTENIQKQNEKQINWNANNNTNIA